MQVDKQTYKDLDIFRGNIDGVSIFEMINKTVTKGGENCLRNKFLNPLSCIDQIVDIQESVSFLTEHLDQWKFPFTENEMISLQNYVSCNIDPLTSNSNSSFLFSGIKFYLIDRHAYIYLKDSIIEISQYLIRFLEALQKLNNQSYPKLLHQIFIEIQGFTKQSVINEFFKKVQQSKIISFIEVFKIDKTLRVLNHEKLKNIITLINEVDALLSMAKATRIYRLTFPNFDPSTSKFEVSDLHHLALQDSVPYSFTVSHNKNILFITGANMAGKTTFLKSVGVSVLLAHIGMAVPATKMTLPFYNRLATSLSVNDSIFNGTSYFYSEVLRVKQVAQWVNSNERVFALFDELFKGTNVKDAYEASLLVISGLANWNQNLFIISSHLSELTTDLKNNETIDYFCFASSIENGIPKFSYQLSKGVNNDKLGLLIIENENIMKLLNPQKDVIN